jgi:putative membrane protein
MERRKSEEAIKTDENNDIHMSDHLANERTFLAWIRTGLTVFGLGCVLARYGGSTNSSPSLMNPDTEKKPIISGLILAICGVVCFLYSLWRFYRIDRQIKNKTTPKLLGPTIAAIVLFVALIPVIIIFFII